MEVDIYKEIFYWKGQGFDFSNGIEVGKMVDIIKVKYRWYFFFDFGYYGVVFFGYDVVVVRYKFN